MKLVNLLNRAAVGLVLALTTAAILGARADACSDLVPQNFGLSGGQSIYQRGSITSRLGASVANQGSSAALASSVGFLIAVDTLPTSERRLLTGGIEPLDDLDTGGIVDLSFSSSKILPADWPLGPAYLVMKVDFGNNLDECIETNNVAFIPIEVIEDPFLRDTVITISYGQPDEFHAVPVTTADYSAIGMRFTNPSPIDTFRLLETNLMLFKQPGTSYDSEADLVVTISRLDTLWQPTAVLFVDTIPGWQIGDGWSQQDSLRWVTIPLAGIGRAVPPEVPGAVEWEIRLSASDLAHIASIAADQTVESTAQSYPCGPEFVYRTAVYSYGKPQSQVYGQGGANITFAGRTTIYGAIPLFSDIYFDHWDHFVNNWPDVVGNQLHIFLSDHWVFRFGTYLFETLGHLRLTVNDIPVNITQYEDWYSVPKNNTKVGMALIESYPEGHYPIRLFVDGTEYYSDCFYTEDRPLLDAPWAACSTYHDDRAGSNDLYQIYATVPKTDIGFDEPISIYGKTYDNYIWHNVRFRQNYSNNGTRSVAVTNDGIKLFVMGEELFFKSTDFQPDEVDLAKGLTDFTFNIPKHTLWKDDMQLFSGTFLYAPALMGAISAKVAGKFGLKGQVDIEAEFSTSPEPSGSLTITPALTPYADVSARVDLLWCLKVLEIGARSDFEMSFPITVLSENDFVPQVDVCIDLDLTLYGSVNLLFKKYTINETYQLYRNCPGEKDNDDYSLHWTTGGFQYETPVMAESRYGQQLAAAWVHHKEGVEDQVFFSWRNESTWTSPEAITATETEKCDAEFCSFGDASWAAIWTESFSGPFDTLAFNKDSLFAGTQRQEIAVAVMDTSWGIWSAPQRLTNDDCGDGRPALAGSEDRVYAVWVKHTGTTNYNPLSTRIVCRVYGAAGAGVWSPAEVLPGQEGHNLQPTVAIDSQTGEAIVVWVQDLDGNVYTHHDRHLRSVRVGKDGKAVAGSLRTIPTMVGPAAPALIAEGEAILTAYESWGYLEDSTGAPVDTIGLGDNIKIGTSIFKNGTWSIRPVGNYITTGYGMNPELAIGQDGTAHLVYRTFEKGDTGVYRGEIAYTAIDVAQSNPSWSRPVRLTNSDKVTYMGDVISDPYGQAIILYLRDEPGQEFPHGFDRIHELTTASDNTPAGQNVELTLSDGTRLEFEQVTSPGYTAAYSNSDGPQLPATWDLLAPPSGAYHNIMTTALYSGQVAVTISYDSTDLPGSEGDLAMLQWNGNSWVKITQSIDPMNDMVTGITSDLTVFALATAGSWACGDANADGAVNISDAVSLLNYIFGGGTAPQPLAAGDPNCDGIVNIADAVSLISYIFSGGDAPCSNCGGKPIGKTSSGGDSEALVTVLRVGGESDEEQAFNVTLFAEEEIAALQLEFEISEGSDLRVVQAYDQESFKLFTKTAGTIVTIGLIDFSGAEPLPTGESHILRLVTSLEPDSDVFLKSAIVVNRRAEVLPAGVQQTKSSANLPESYILNPNYPNPFNPVTTISYALPKATNVNLSIYNILGQEVRTLVDDLQQAGRHEILWDGRDGQNEPAASGVYFYRLTTDDFSDTRKMMLLK